MIGSKKTTPAKRWHRVSFASTFAASAFGRQGYNGKMVDRRRRGVSVFSFFAILLALLGTSFAERNKHIAAANAHCSIDCGRNGYCEYQKYNDYPQQGDFGWFPFCACFPGFGGGSCEKKIEECQPPEFKCSNGAP